MPEVDTACDPKVDIVNSPLTDEVNVPIVEHPTNPGNAQPMVKPAITVVRVVIMPDTAIQHTTLPLREDIHAVIYMIWSRQKTLNMTLFRLFEKLPLGLTATRNRSAYSGNVMFDEIASVKKCNLRVLSDLLVASHNRKHTVRFKLDTGAGGNMLPYDVWQRFFPGRSNANLACTIDKSVSLQAYNKSEIRQLGTCNLTVSHNGVLHTCHFFVVPSQYRPILGLSDLLTLHLVTFNCPTTTSWSSRTSVMLSLVMPLTRL